MRDGVNAKNRKGKQMREITEIGGEKVSPWLREARDQAVSFMTVAENSFNHSLATAYKLAPLLHNRELILEAYCEAIVALTAMILTKHVTSQIGFEEQIVELLRSKFASIRSAEIQASIMKGPGRGKH